jgi:hypothetical protein
MNYHTGEKVLIGDRITVDRSPGVVLCVIEDGQFSNAHPRETVGLFEEGDDGRSRRLGLVHYPEVDDDIEYIGRQV